MPVKILFLTLKTFSLTGGIEKVCRTICRALYDLSENSQLVTPTIYCMYDKDYERDSRYLNKHQFKGFNASKKLFVLKSLITGLRSDVILLSHINLLNVGFLIKELRSCKKIYLIAHGIEVWKKLPESKLKVLRNLDKIICVSQFTADKVIELHQIPSEKVVVINNCLDPFFHVSTSFKKPQVLLERYQLNNQHKILFSLSRLSFSEKYKGYDHNIELLPKLLKAHPNLIYLIGGKWDSEEKKRLDNLINKFHLEENVRVIGFIDEGELTDHFLLSDIFIMPSKKEGFGIVFIEAIASGLRVIGGNKDGTIDALKNGALGALVDPDDLADIEEKIRYYLDRPQTNQDKLELQQRCLEAFNFEDYKKAFKSILLT